MTLENFLTQLNKAPESIQFSDTIACIEAHYYYTPTAFQNGSIRNSNDENQGSCKVFSFAQLNQLDKTQTLHCFGDFYRNDVLKQPNADNHQNIRNFMQSGWSGISFEHPALISHNSVNTALDTKIAAEVFSKLLNHLDNHKEVQNIDLMILANFCRNCLSKWYMASAKEHGKELDYDKAREIIYGIPYSDWKEQYQTDATPEQLAALEQKQK